MSKNDERNTNEIFHREQYNNFIVKCNNAFLGMPRYYLI